MFYIVITKIPRGEPPLRIKRAWLGLLLPCVSQAPAEVVTGAVTGKIAYCEGDEKGVFHVPQFVALEILAEANPEAAMWWDNHGYPKPNGLFVFRQDEAKLVSPPGK